ncbi:MAG TPA: hypothetical protein VN706_12540 [Gemmatimonadaceae bacterium]|nr:hypothetical protein [Gemmatimonadaceae bacterium]
MTDRRNVFAAAVTLLIVMAPWALHAQADTSAWYFCTVNATGIGSYSLPATDQTMETFAVSNFLIEDTGTAPGSGSGAWYDPDPPDVKTYNSARQTAYQWMSPADHFTCTQHTNADGSNGGIRITDDNTPSGWAQVIEADEVASNSGGTGGGGGGDAYCIFSVSYDPWGDVTSIDNTGICSDDPNTLIALI